VLISPPPPSCSVTRADFAKFLAAGAATAAMPALAAGTGPKQNLFGVVGWGEGNNVGGGGYSSPYAEADTYSPYSPYSNTGKADALAVKQGMTADMKKSYVATVKECSKRFESVPRWVDGRDWMEIPAELTRRAYPLRDSMNRLAEASGKQEAKDAAKKYYQDLELMTVNARRKKPDLVKAAYKKSVEDLSTYLALIN
jgi:hypothetical protein